MNQKSNILFKLRGFYISLLETLFFFYPNEKENFDPSKWGNIKLI
jgi:hypothetical protein